MITQCTLLRAHARHKKDRVNGAQKRKRIARAIHREVCTDASERANRFYLDLRPLVFHVSEIMLALSVLSRSLNLCRTCTMIVNIDSYLYFMIYDLFMIYETLSIIFLINKIFDTSV